MADRSVLVTGGTGGLGAAVTAAFVEAGWRVVAPQRRPPAPTPGRTPTSRSGSSRT
ncbi:NAD-dependent epimerase/dehydratase family protein [Micromonospora tarapacensis]|uniref:NAD-dependent epimerase/dehydratase family protein n=1 Tax=Micromonospora tarapacensis TaxID=2835305 RepID=UPI001E3CC382|nr:NAD-dependent epimerase/dehydratase family protein [Micromonospora tarapacensis]